MKNVKHVLLAEDNQDEYVQFIRTINTIDPGIEVMRVDNGYNLLSMLQTSIQPDAIFLDINMPFKNGLTTLQEVREIANCNHVPVVILSASINDSNIDLAYKLGANYFVKKDYTHTCMEDLFTKVFSSRYFGLNQQPPKSEFLVC